MRSSFRSTSGFSIVGVLVAAGMMSGLALYLANVSKQQHITQKKAETWAELKGLTNKILSVLYDGDACTKTFGVGSSFQDGDTLTQLKTKDGTVVVQTGSAGVVNRILEVEKMEIDDVQAVPGTNRKKANMMVTIKKLGVANVGMTTMKTFSVTAEMDSSGTIARCHHALNDTEDGIKTRMCEEMGGEMLETISGSGVKRCSIDKLYEKYCDEMGGNYSPEPVIKCDLEDVLADLCTGMGGNWSAGACSMTPVLQNLCTSLGGTPNGDDCDIASVYADVSGDTMTGPLNCTNFSCTGNISAGGVAEADQ